MRLFSSRLRGSRTVGAGRRRDGHDPNTLTPSGESITPYRLAPSVALLACGGERIIGLVAAARRSAELAVHCALGHQCGQPIFVGEAEPAAAVAEGLGAAGCARAPSRGHPAERAGQSLPAEPDASRVHGVPGDRAAPGLERLPRRGPPQRADRRRGEFRPDSTRRRRAHRGDPRPLGPVRAQHARRRHQSRHAPGWRRS